MTHIEVTFDPKVVAQRRPVPTRRKSIKIKSKVNNFTVHFDFGFYKDGSLAEVFINTSKEGSEMRELMQAVARITSMSLQYGIPTHEIVKTLKDERTGNISAELARLIEELQNDRTT
jgi:hypothetical protein